MESLKNESLWLTRRNTRSSSNQEKEAKEKILALENKQEEELKKKDHLGSIIRGNNNEVVGYSTLDGTTYNLLDSAYIATERSDNPYFIGTIQEIKVSKKDHAILVVKWYYRPAEVPDTVYQMLLKDRLDGTIDPKKRKLMLKDENLNRELFIADEDMVDMFPVSALRGKCHVKHLDKFEDLKKFDLKPDCFFYILSYNPETRRLASAHHGEVRVGPSHQWTASTRGIFHKALIPDLISGKESRNYMRDRNYEELTWEPKVNDVDLKMYLCSARSMAAFAGMCDGGSPEEGLVIASRDDITINALQVLFENKMDTRSGVQALVKNPLPITIERRWTEEQVKRFQKGIRQNGKNFFKIKKDLLPTKQTSELVEFYYLWKKVQENLLIQPQNKNKRQTGLRRNTKKDNNDTGGEVSSSELDSESEGSDKDVTPEKCHHCHTTSSEDWVVGGKDGFVLCTECRVTFKKYGTVKVVDLDFDKTHLLNPDESPPHFMFKPIKEKVEEIKQEKVGIQDKKKTVKRQWEKIENIKEEIVDKKSKHLGNAEEIDQSNEEKINEPARGPSVKGEVTTTTKPQIIKPMTTTQDPVYSLTPQKPQFQPLSHGGESPFTQICKNGENKQNLQKVSSPIKESTNHLVQPSIGDQSIAPSNQTIAPNNQQPTMPKNQPIPSNQQPVSNQPQFASSKQQFIGPNIQQPFTPGNQQTGSSNNQLVGPNNQPVHSNSNHGNQPLPGNQISTQPTQQRSRPPDKMTTSDWPVEDGVQPIRVPRENHLTIPAGKPWPPEFKYFDDGLPAPPRGTKPSVCFRLKKVTLLGYPNHLCSRTDLVWESPKRPLKQEPRPPQRVDLSRGHSGSHPDSVGQHRTPENRGEYRDQGRLKKDKPGAPLDLMQVKKERIQPRPQHSIHLTPGSAHMTPGQHHMTPGQHHLTPGQHHMNPGQHHLTPGSNRTPSHTPTPAGFDPHRPTPSHSSPYGNLGAENTASRTLRQIAYGDMANANSQHLYPFSVQQPQSERDLRERELREIRERIPKQNVEGLKLVDLDPAQAMLIQGVPPNLMQGFINQQSALEQLRQQPFPALLGLPGTSQGGFPQFLPPDLLHQSAVERITTERLNAERIAIEHYRMELLHNHQHSHVHSHLHLHPSNQPPLPPSALPPTGVIQPGVMSSDPMIHPYAAAAMQQAQALAAAGVDPIHAASMTSQMMSGLRPPAPGILGPPGIPPRPESLHQYLTATQQLQAVAHEQNFIEHQRAQEEYMRLMGHKP